MLFRHLLGMIRWLENQVYSIWASWSSDTSLRSIPSFEASMHLLLLQKNVHCISTDYISRNSECNTAMLLQSPWQLFKISIIWNLRMLHTLHVDALLSVPQKTGIWQFLRKVQNLKLCAGIKIPEQEGYASAIYYSSNSSCSLLSWNALLGLPAIMPGLFC